MQLSGKNINVRKLGTTRFYRVVLCFAVIIFSLQLMGSAFHKHGIDEHPSDCVSCTLIAHFPSDVPSASIDILPTLTVLNYWIAATPLYFYVAQQSYLIPHSQAPPLHSSSL